MNSCTDVTESLPRERAESLLLIPVAGAILVTVAIAWLNIIGGVFRQDSIGGAYCILHGNPLAYMAREVQLTNEKGMPYGYASLAPFQDHARVLEFSWWRLAVDVIVAIVLVLLTYRSLKWALGNGHARSYSWAVLFGTGIWLMEMARYRFWMVSEMGVLGYSIGLCLAVRDLSIFGVVISSCCWLRDHFAGPHHSVDSMVNLD